jgi:glycosyltransferase involved in cell wall biosynthesis
MEYWWEYSGAAPGKCIVIPLSVNHRHFYPHIDAKIKMGWHDTLKHLVFVGRLVAENHPEYLLEIVKHLAKRNIRFRVHIVGDGPKNNELQQLAIELNISDHIEWHGWVKFQDLPLYYSASDLMIFTRASGAPPRVIPQAMACGCPVASVNNPGLFDYIQPGDNGFIISAENSLEAAKTISDNLESRSKLSDLGKRAREYTKKNLSLEVIAKRTISEVYQPLLSHS